VLVRLIVTPGKSAPDSSRTTPARLAPIDWPAAGAATIEIAMPTAATEFQVMALLALTNRGVDGPGPGRPLGVIEAPERNIRADLLTVFRERLEFSGVSIGGP